MRGRELELGQRGVLLAGQPPGLGAGGPHHGAVRRLVEAVGQVRGLVEGLEDSGGAQSGSGLPQRCQEGDAVDGGGAIAPQWLARQVLDLVPPPGVHQVCGVATTEAEEGRAQVVLLAVRRPLAVVPLRFRIEHGVGEQPMQVGVGPAGLLMLSAAHGEVERLHDPLLPAGVLRVDDAGESVERVAGDVDEAERLGQLPGPRGVRNTLVLLLPAHVHAGHARQRPGELARRPEGLEDLEGAKRHGFALLSTDRPPVGHAEASERIALAQGHAVLVPQRDRLLEGLARWRPLVEGGELAAQGVEEVGSHERLVGADEPQRAAVLGHGLASRRQLGGPVAGAAGVDGPRRLRRARPRRGARVGRLVGSGLLELGEDAAVDLGAGVRADLLLDRPAGDLVTEPQHRLRRPRAGRRRRVRRAPRRPPR